ncbi:MAG: lectin-like domain-containing protein [Enterococcus viikkiensis]
MNKKSIAVFVIFSLVSFCFSMPVAAIVPHKFKVSDNDVTVTKDTFLDYFSLRGTASYEQTTGIVTLTQDQQNQVGNFTLNDRIDLAGSFSLKGAVNLGDKLDSQGGADGIGVAFHTGKSTDIGEVGESIGIGGLPNALGFKLDTYWNQTDPTEGRDHPFGAFVRTGSTPPYSAETDKDSIQYLGKDAVSESGEVFHDFSVTYNGQSKEFSVTYQSERGPLFWQTTVPNTIEAYSLAMSASTGGNSNKQQFRMDQFEYSSKNEADTKGSIVLQVKDQTGQAIKGAIFYLYGADDQLVSELMTNDDGNIKVEELPFGSYYFIEKSVPAGYIKDPDRHHLTVDKDHRNQTITVINQKELFGKLKILVRDSVNHQPLSGSMFVLRNDDTQTEVNSTTEALGVESFSQVPYGNYQIVQKKASNGYIRTSNQKIELNKPDQEIIIENTKVINKGTVLVNVVDQKKVTQPIAAVTFVLKDQTGKVVTTVKTDAQGKFKVADLPYGQYLLEQTSFLTGYQEVEQTRSFNLQSPEMTLTLTNRRKAASSQTEKIEDTKETTPPRKHPASSTAREPKTVTSQSETIRRRSHFPSTAGTIKKNMKQNTQEKGILTIVNHDTQGSLLGNSTFMVYSEDKQSQYQLRLGPDGRGQLDLPYGEYIVHQTAASVGFAKNPKRYRVILNKDHSTQQIIIQNSQLKASKIKELVNQQTQTVLPAEENELIWTINIDFRSDVLETEELVLTNVLPKELSLERASSTSVGGLKDYGTFSQKGQQLMFKFKKHEDSFSYLINQNIHLELVSKKAALK